MTDAPQQMPLFEGFTPQVNQVRISGRLGRDQSEVYRLGDKVFFLISAHCVGVNHERKGKAQDLARIHKFDVIGARRVNAEEEISEALVREAMEYLETVQGSEPAKDGDGKDEDDEA